VIMADEIISPSDLGIDKAALTESFTEAAASALAVAYLAVQSLFQVRPISAQYTHQQHSAAAVPKLSPCNKRRIRS
jgi:hypothetical protein